MEIKHLHKNGVGAFVINENGKREAEMVYTMDDSNVMTIVHTEVSEELQGQNIGKKLVAAGVEYARANHIKVVPQCPFAKSVFDRMKEYQDVLA